VSGQLDLLGYVAPEPVTEPQATMAVSTGPHLWEREQPEPLVNRPLLLLLDANNLGHRLFHAPSNDRTLAERFGFALNRWRRVVNPDFAIAVFDGEGPSWRHELWPAYKAKRDDDPSKRPSATDWLDIMAECKANRLRFVQVPGVEADDLIASYVAAARRIHVDVSIVSSDKDLMQLIADEPTRVRTIDPGDGKLKGQAECRERWGVEPCMLADLLALAGDDSDNYPGVRGIGAKGAAKLINEHGGVEQILERVNLLKPKLGEKLRAQADEARLFRRLAGLVDDLPLPVSIESATW
jgi:DNA polymerase-1